ncbi:hypothetical protein B0A49_00840 [Cryomyces minteri]|uniref:Uncharacterized protein n=1 Tax=Cryomyces minteri TaxID=331657 RepID=A0A4V5NHY2_9PEZI|nr:hypothetical protein B0A49_04520 [Cryomyces minteri]TKA80524.1 hypothetical protein B0A49_01015 [Cryomyces minteri]TKA80889.1 hypothetical protein B0A49_00840 [Cryomyces minteri]
MSASKNTPSVAGQEGGFHPTTHGSEPLPGPKHHPGVLASANDRAPEFSAETLPAGTAPADRTFKPNPTSDVPTTNTDYSDDADAEAERTSASDTLGGATSADVHTGYGHPGQGQTSSELHGRKRDGAGLEGVGASGVPSAKLVDAHDPEHVDQRAADRDDAVVGRGSVGGDSAQDRVPESADTVAREAPRS